MIIHSKAPLRIGLAGGGTDVSPYADEFGGAVLNTTISLYAHTTIEINDKGGMIIEANDIQEFEALETLQTFVLNGKLDLHKAVINRIQKDHTIPYTNFKLSTFVDAPLGSGLGTSSTLVVSMIGAFAELLKLTFTPLQIAQYAYDIERVDAGFAGGRQDQFAASFGGFNFIEFCTNGESIVTPIQLSQEQIIHLENNFILYYSGISRESATIIKEQQKNVKSNNIESINAMHQLKNQAQLMKDALHENKLEDIGTILDFGFAEKRKMANNISNYFIENIYVAAKNAGASGGKISGAGGGGFMIFYCKENTKLAVVKALENFGGSIKEFKFTTEGLSHYSI